MQTLDSPNMKDTTAKQQHITHISSSESKPEALHMLDQTRQTQDKEHTHHLQNEIPHPHMLDEMPTYLMLDEMHAHHMLDKTPQHHDAPHMFDAMHAHNQTHLSHA